MRMRFSSANFVTETFAIKKKLHFRVKNFRDQRKMRGKHNFLVFILHSFKQQIFRPRFDNTLCFTLIVTMTIYKVLWPERPKIGVIKEHQHKRLKKQEKIGREKLSLVENFL